MTPQKALILLNDMEFEDKYQGKEEYTDMLLLCKTALEKQIPKKTIPHKVEAEPIKIGNGKWEKGTTVYNCPCCGEWNSRIYKCCHNCGQALDWSGTE